MPPSVWCIGLLASALVAATIVCSTVRRRDARVRSAEEAMRRAEQRLRFAVDAISETVWEWDLKTDALYQPRFSRAYGYPEETTPRTGATFLPYLHPDDRRAFGALLEEARRGERDELELEHRVRAASGEWLWMSGRARVVERGPDGEALRIVGTCADVTERRRMLERLQLADRLVSVGTLAAGVAHEINNPLSFVSANVAFALEVLDGAVRAGGTPGALARAAEDCRIALREAAAGAGRVGQIVRDLKLLSRGAEDPLVAIDAGRALDAAVRLARKELEQRARLTVEVGDVPPVLADESRITQVFLNLLVNAAQALPEGRPAAHEVEVRLSAEDGRVVLRVRDTGCGIPAENLKRIFDPFFTTKPAGVGTGLGLAISHRIVTAFGGDIEVVSAPGEGSTFRVSFPAFAPADPGWLSGAAAEPVSPTAPSIA